MTAWLAVLDIPTVLSEKQFPLLNRKLRVLRTSLTTQAPTLVKSWCNLCCIIHGELKGVSDAVGLRRELKTRPQKMHVIVFCACSKPLEATFGRRRVREGIESIGGASESRRIG